MVWRSVCSAVQGRGHKKNDFPCQDKVAMRADGGVNVIALADGAGSARMSHYGAECVVNRVAAYVADRFYELIAEDDGAEFKRRILTVALEALNNEAELREGELRDLASTLLLAAVDDEKFLLVHLGDGVLGYLSDKGLKAASTPDNGEFANETVFVTSKSAINHMRIFKGTLGTICGFILMSDGTEQSLYNKRNKTLSEGVKRLMHRTSLIDSAILEPQLQEAIESVILENTLDDCSIALLARTSDLLPPLEELSTDNRKELFKLDPKCRNVSRKMERFDEICEALRQPLTLKQLSRRLHIKARHAEKKIMPLLAAGVVVKQGALYKTY